MPRSLLSTRRPHLMTRLTLAVAAAAFVATPAAHVQAQSVQQQGWNPKEVLARETYVRPPAVVERIVTAPRNAVALTNPSPDRRHFLKVETEGLPGIEAFGKFHYRLGGLEIDPKANRARALTTRGGVGLTVVDPHTGKLSTLETPKGALVNAATWSPDGRSIAYIASFDAATHVYVAELASGRSRQVTRTPILATRVTTVDWTADGSGIVTVLVPSPRGPEPKRPEIETGPLVRFSDGKVLKNRNYASLLRDQYEKDLLDYYTTGQLAVVDVKTRAERKVGKPALITSVDASPDARYFRVTLQTKPYSYLVPVSNFGTVEQLWDANGNVVVAELEKRDLREGDANDTTQSPAYGGRGGAASDTGRRELRWNPVGSGLVYLLAERAPVAAQQRGPGAAGATGSPRGRGPNATPRKDRLYRWVPPFGVNDTTMLFESPARMTSADFSADGKTLVVNASDSLYVVRLSDSAKHYLIAKRATVMAAGRGRLGAGGAFGGRNQPADSLFYSNPGAVKTRLSSTGGQVVVFGSDGKTVFLEGTKYAPDWVHAAPRTFVDKVDFESGKTTRIFEGAADAAESVVEPLDDDYAKVIVARETPSRVQDSYLRDLATGASVQLTHNTDFAPEVTRAIRRRILVSRPGDDFKFWVNVTLPRDYRPGTRLPGIIWFYPSEFANQTEYDRTKRSENINRFPVVGPRSPEIWVTQGYAVIQPDNPIVGPTGRMNDHYVDELRRNLDATIEAVDSAGFVDKSRLGIGGHSYGAFSTVNAMVHTPYFKAGIAGDGMYNRTLTPYAFQNERRDFWEAKDTYLEMSPFLYADRLTGALLMYHSLEDQNVGTDPISSIRMMQALQGQGKTAALFMYPYEDHGPATRESDLDQWARWIAWFDTYVKPGKGGNLVP
ncbi:MAG TPA: prolyl oligopeptidase family serine peptidase [Gemmatimonadaceae bacterium]